MSAESGSLETILAPNILDNEPNEAFFNEFRKLKLGGILIPGFETKSFIEVNFISIPLLIVEGNCCILNGRKFCGFQSWWMEYYVQQSQADAQMDINSFRNRSFVTIVSTVVGNGAMGQL